MRINIYAEEITDRVELIEKKTLDGVFVGIRFYTELPVTIPEHREGTGVNTIVTKARNVKGPFIHRPGDDDSAAVTFWGKRELRKTLQKALDLLDKHYDERSAL